jgi:hypothetical protein
MATATEVLTAQVAASRCASKAVPRLASLPELRTYNCKPCLSMNAQITNQGTFAKNFWLQSAVLGIAVVALIVLAVTYIW